MAKIGDRIKFTKRPMKALGECVVTNVSFGRKWFTWDLIGVSDTNKNKIFKATTLTVDIEQYGDFICSDLNVVANSHKLLENRLDDLKNASVIAKLTYSPGDIVFVSTTKHSWNMQIVEVDSVKGRLKGINSDNIMVSSRMAWVSLLNPNVTISIVRAAPSSYDATSDTLIIRHKEKALMASKNRATTKAIRMLRSYVNMVK